MNVDAFYINLASAAARRTAIEASIRAASFSANWSWRRFEAVTVDDAALARFESTMRRGTLGVSLSHLAAMSTARHFRNAYAFIAEDDTVFSSRTEAAVADAVAQLADKPWDILFTDACVPNIGDMVSFYTMRNRWSEGSGVSLVDLQQTNFCAMSAYVLNADSKEKVADYFSRNFSANTPIDLLMRNAVHSGALRAYLTFPFTTSLSEYANVSSDARNNDLEVVTNVLWNAFRQLTWIDADPQSVMRMLEHIPPAFYDERAVVFARILQGLVSKNFLTI